MTDLEHTLLACGLPPSYCDLVVDAVEERNARTVRSQAGHLLHLIFLRIDRDSVAGCALRRALGFSGGISLTRAAKDFCVSKQYLEELQSELEAKLGDLSFLAQQDRGRAALEPGPRDAMDHLVADESEPEPIEPAVEGQQ